MVENVSIYKSLVVCFFLNHDITTNFDEIWYSEISIPYWAMATLYFSLRERSRWQVLVFNNALYSLFASEVANYSGYTPWLNEILVGWFSSFSPLLKTRVCKSGKIGFLKALTGVHQSKLLLTTKLLVLFTLKCKLELELFTLARRRMYINRRNKVRLLVVCIVRSVCEK